MSTTWEVKALRYATLETTYSDYFYRYELYGQPDRPIRMDYFIWLLENGDERVLVDTGFDPIVGKRRGRDCIVEPVEALRRIGVAPEELTRIIVSHFHYDHIGNLAAFPNATYVMQRREYDFWTGPLADRPQFASATEAHEIEHLKKASAEGRVQIIDGESNFAPGIRLELVGGHCPGQQVAIVDGTSRQVVLASDALHFYEEMERDWPFMLFSDLAEMYTAYETLRNYEHSGAAIVAGHDPRVMESFEALRGNGAGIGVRVA